MSTNNFKTKPNETAYPVAHAQRGLTKREEFAKAAMQGLISHPEYLLWEIAETAVEAADALIYALNKDEDNHG